MTDERPPEPFPFAALLPEALEALDEATRRVTGPELPAFSEASEP
jgi:hypothetical protein